MKKVLTLSGNEEDIAKLADYLGVNDGSGKSTLVNEGRKPKLKFKKDHPTYMAGYGQTLNAITDYIEENGYFFNQQEFFTAFGDAFFKPKKGKTQSKTITIFQDKESVKPIGNLHISIYNRGVDGNTYELTMYADQFMGESFDEKLHNQSLTKSNVKIFEKILMFRNGTLELENDEKEFIPFLSKISESKLQKFKDFEFNSKISESILDFDKFETTLLESKFIKRHLKPFLMMEGLNDYAIEKLVEGFLKVKHIEYCKYFKGNVNEGKKSPAVKFILQKMDSEEDGIENYEEYLAMAIEKFPKVKKEELEKELDLYI